jgi:putative transposase
MSRRGNCWDNAVVELFFVSLKKERTKQRDHKTRDLACADVSDYIKLLFNQARRIAILAALAQRPSGSPHFGVQRR